MLALLVIAVCLVAAFGAALGAPDERAALAGDRRGWWAGSAGRR